MTELYEEIQDLIKKYKIAMDYHEAEYNLIHCNCMECCRAAGEEWAKARTYEETINDLTDLLKEYADMMRRTT